MADEKIQLTQAELSRIIADAVAQSRGAPAAPKDPPPLTKANSHRATARGYAIAQTDPPEARAGVLIEPGQMVPADVPVSENWMQKISKRDGDDRASAAAEEARAPRNQDPDLTKLSKAALEAMATERGVTSVQGLSKDALIAAIKAAYEPQAQ